VAVSTAWRAVASSACSDATKLAEYCCAAPASSAAAAGAVAVALAARATGSITVAADATGSATAVSADANSVAACTSVSSDRLEAPEKPKELKKPHSFSPDILLFA